MHEHHGGRQIKVQHYASVLNYGATIFVQFRWNQPFSTRRSSGFQLGRPDD